MIIRKNGSWRDAGQQSSDLEPEWTWGRSGQNCCLEWAVAMRSEMNVNALVAEWAHG
jgi:hypothetical protein